MVRYAWLAAILALSPTCGSGGGAAPAPGGGSSLPRGTWGGDNAAVRVADTAIHVHIGCTLGNAPLPDWGASSGFEVSGRYNITVYPVNLGIWHPAVFRGAVTGNEMRLTVQLSDTTVTLGPVVVTYGSEPRMRMCPVCRSPKEGG